MAVQTTTQASLYRRCVGVEYDALPTILRHFHDAETGASALGIFRITRGQGVVRNVLANLMALPKAGEQVTVHLKVKVERGGERWIRHFDSQCLITEQWIQNGLLVEAAGPIRFGFRLSADGESMGFEMERCWLMALPLPLFLAPRVSARVTGRETSWWAMVQVELPMIGMLARYEGEMVPQC